MRSLLCVAVVLCVSMTARATFAPPQEVPVERLITNISAYIRENPKDAMGYFTLARVHYLAFSRQVSSLYAYRPDGLPTVPDMFGTPRGAEKALDEKAMQLHVKSGMENYLKAMELDKDKALFHLGLASLLESASESKLALPEIPGVKDPVDAKDWKSTYVREAIARYVQAFDLAKAGDLKRESQPLHGMESLISYESGTKLLKLLKAKEPLDDADKKRVQEVEKTLAALKAKPMGPITPIVFSLDGADALADLLDPGCRVKFDLDGTGRGQAWPWLRGGTALLVWDPKGTGRIESGRQLFGSVAFNMFWRDGYAALDALDDNRDGRLTGAELDGLAAWRDANQNGVSDPGEVESLTSIGVAGISARWDEKDGASPMNRLGLKLRDGRVLPTWDWMVEPAGK